MDHNDNYNDNMGDKWVPVTTVWRVLRLRMEEPPPIWRGAANILNKQPRTADKGWSSSLGVGRGANKSSPQKRRLLRNIHTENNNKASHRRRETLWRHSFTDYSWLGFETLWRGSSIDVSNVTHCNAEGSLVTSALTTQRSLGNPAPLMVRTILGQP